MKIIITESQLKNLISQTPGKKEVMNMIHLKLLKVIDGVKIYLVDGELVRDRITIEYTMGGHHYRYPFIPEDEVWIDNAMDKDDIEATIIHEMHERTLMKYKGLSYSTAHARSSEVEKVFRKKHGMQYDDLKKLEHLNESFEDDNVYNFPIKSTKPESIKDYGYDYEYEFDFKNDTLSLRIYVGDEEYSFDIDFNSKYEPGSPPEYEHGIMSYPGDDGDLYMEFTQIEMIEPEHHIYNKEQIKEYRKKSKMLNIILGEIEAGATKEWEEWVVQNSDPEYRFS